MTDRPGYSVRLERRRFGWRAHVWTRYSLIEDYRFEVLWRPTKRWALAAGDRVVARFRRCLPHPDESGPSLAVPFDRPGGSADVPLRPVDSQDAS